MICRGVRTATGAQLLVMAGLNARVLQSKLLITPLSELSHNNYYYNYVQPKITYMYSGLGYSSYHIGEPSQVTPALCI